MSEDLVLLEVSKLATYLADMDFVREFENNYPFEELYEQVDETDNHYLRSEYQDIYDHLVDDWTQRIRSMERKFMDGLLKS